MEKYTYQLLTSENLPDLNELFRAAFNSEPCHNLMQWKYFSNPAGDAILVGAFYENRLVASGAMVPEKMSVFGKDEFVFKCTDLMTHPDHQRKGMSKRINELLSKETKKNCPIFSYTLCSIVSTKSFVKNDWIFMEKVINFFKPKIMLRLSILFKRENFKSFGFYDIIGNHLESYKFNNDKARILLKKDTDYLKWRTSNPNFTYKIICSYDNLKNVNGYLLYSISQNNLLNVVDVDSVENDMKITNQLLACAEYVTVKEKYKAIVILTIKNTPFYNYIKSKSYLRNPLKKGPLQTILDFNIIKYNANINNISDIRVWDINGLSYDDI